MLNEFLKIMKLYKKNKLIWINKAEEENLLISYINENTGQIGNILTFIFEKLFEVFEAKEKADNGAEHDYILTQLFTSKHAYGYFIFLNTLICSEPKIKEVLYLMLTNTSEKDDKSGIIKKGKRHCTWGKTLEKIEKNRESYKKVISIIYYLVYEFG